MAIRDVASDSAIDGVLRPRNLRVVDMTRVSEFPEAMYTPLIEKAIPGSVKEFHPAWMDRLPTRILEAIRDHPVSSVPSGVGTSYSFPFQVLYGHVRTFVILTSTTTKDALLSSLKDRKIIDQDFQDHVAKRAEHAPVSLSNLSKKGVDDI